MKWYKYLYVGQSLQGKEQQVRSLIAHGKRLPYAYVITRPGNPQNLMDLIPADELRKPLYPKESLQIIGIAGDRGEAMELAAQMVDEAYRETGQVNIEALLAKRFRENRRKEGGTAT